MRILIVDDHALVRDGIAGILEAAGHQVIGQLDNGLEAIEATARLKPDLVLMDISMPELSGIEALLRIRESDPEVPVVMLTVSDEDADLLAAMKAGAKGYLMKNLTSEGFLEALQGLERGEYAINPELTNRLINGLLESPVVPEAYTIQLTRRQDEVLRLIAAGLSNKEIARELVISENTVKYYVKKILQKMDAQNRAEAVALAMRLGILKENEF